MSASRIGRVCSVCGDSLDHNCEAAGLREELHQLRVDAGIWPGLLANREAELQQARERIAALERALEPAIALTIRIQSQEAWESREALHLAMLVSQMLRPLLDAPTPAEPAVHSGLLVMGQNAHKPEAAALAATVAGAIGQIAQEPVASAKCPWCHGVGAVNAINPEHPALRCTRCGGTGKTAGGVTGK